MSGPYQTEDKVMGLAKRGGYVFFGYLGQQATQFGVTASAH